MFSFFKKEEEAPEKPKKFKFIYKADIHTTKGVMKIDLFDVDTPVSTKSFYTLATKGFYNGLEFFRKIPDMLIQTGCPKNDGTSGCGYFTKCEIYGGQQEHDKGILAFAHNGRNMNGSQFYICLDKDNCAQFNGHNTCFAKIYEGLEIVDELEIGDKIENIVTYEIEVEIESE